MFTKAHLSTAVVALAAFAIVAAIQKKGMKVPVIGGYLPGGQ